MQSGKNLNGFHRALTYTLHSLTILQTQQSLQMFECFYSVVHEHRLGDLCDLIYQSEHCQFSLVVLLLHGNTIMLLGRCDIQDSKSQLSPFSQHPYFAVCLSKEFKQIKLILICEVCTALFYNNNNPDNAVYCHVLPELKFILSWYKWKESTHNVW